MNVKAYFLTIVLISVALGIGLGNLLRSPVVTPVIRVIKNVSSRCYVDLDCAWMITNCCREEAGAKWECVNMKTFKPRDCPKNVICPMVVSPKPSPDICVCREGNCVVE
jgi:hypothetical protein